MTESVNLAILYLGETMSNNQILEHTTQLKIINVSIELFSKNGYKKTSIKDISEKSIVSKSLIFHYFKSKKNLYLYLINYVLDIANNEVLFNIPSLNKDLFQVLEIIQKHKISFYLKYPNYFEFLDSVRVEENLDVIEDISKILDSKKTIDMNYLFKNIDQSNLRNEVSIEEMINLITWITEGYVKTLKRDKKTIKMNTFNEFNRYMEIIKESILKEI